MVSGWLDEWFNIWMNEKTLGGQGVGLYNPWLVLNELTTLGHTQPH